MATAAPKFHSKNHTLCARRGLAPQESTSPLTKASFGAFLVTVSCLLSISELALYVFSSVQKFAPCSRVLYIASGCTNVFCAACDCQDSTNSTGFLAAFETSVVPLVLCSILRAVGLHGFCLPDSVMYKAIIYYNI